MPASPRRHRPSPRGRRAPERGGAGTTNCASRGRAARRSDWATCHVCAVGRPNVVAAPIAVHRLVRITAMVPTTARMGAGTRFSAKSAGTADPTAAAASSGPDGPSLETTLEEAPDRGGGNHGGCKQADIRCEASKCAHHSTTTTEPRSRDNGRVGAAVGVVTTSAPVGRRHCRRGGVVARASGLGLGEEGQQCDEAVGRGRSPGPGGPKAWRRRSQVLRAFAQRRRVRRPRRGPSSKAWRRWTPARSSNTIVTTSSESGRKSWTRRAPNRASACQESRCRRSPGS